VRALKGDKKTDNGIAFHHKTTGHIFNFESVELLEKEENYWRRIILEGIHIKKGKNLANLKNGCEIDKCWDPIIEAIDLKQAEKKHEGLHATVEGKKKTLIKPYLIFYS
jgi:hypothetical protein